MASHLLFVWGKRAAGKPTALSLHVLWGLPHERHLARRFVPSSSYCVQINESDEPAPRITRRPMDRDQESRSVECSSVFVVAATGMSASGKVQSEPGSSDGVVRLASPSIW